VVVISGNSFPALKTVIGTLPVPHPMLTERAEAPAEACVEFGLVMINLLVQSGHRTSKDAEI
jgi:hypothetical protein